MDIYNLLKDQKPGNYSLTSSRKLTDEERKECLKLADKGIKIGFIRVDNSLPGIALVERSKEKDTENPTL